MLFVTGFVKTNRIITTVEIQFIVLHCSYIQPLSRHTNYKATDGQVCFHRRSFADPVKPRWSTTGSMEPLMGINNTEDTTYTAVCLLVGGIARLWLPTHPQRPPPINFIHDIAGVVKNHYKNQQC